MNPPVFVVLAVILAALVGSLYAGYYDAPSSVYHVPAEAAPSYLDSASTTSYPTSAYSTSGYGKNPVASAVGMATLDPPMASAFDTDAINFDLYGGYAFAQDNTGPLSQDGAVFGIGVETFYTEVWGARLQGHYWDSAVDVGDFSASIIARFPTRGSLIVPYVFGGGGGVAPSDQSFDWTYHVGVGLDYRFRGIENMGLNLDFRRTWTARYDGYYLVTLGLRLSF